MPLSACLFLLEIHVELTFAKWYSSFFDIFRPFFQYSCSTNYTGNPLLAGGKCELEGELSELAPPHSVFMFVTITTNLFTTNLFTTNLFTTNLSGGVIRPGLLFNPYVVIHKDGDQMRSEVQ